MKLCISADHSHLTSTTRTTCLTALGLAVALTGCALEGDDARGEASRALSRPSSCGVASDLNGDGFADLVIGVPGEDVGALTDSGAISVMFGAAAGLTATGNRLIAPAIPVGGAGDQFGAAVTTGDFNGDCLADIAVGAPFDDVGATGNAGSVHIFYGSTTGLAATSDQVWHLDTVGIPGLALAGDRFGTALASGDFDGDGYMDLAIGNPHRRAPGLFGGPDLPDVGSVVVLYGSPTGLSTTGVQTWAQGAAIGDTLEFSDRFGWSLAAGDFNGDGFDSLAVGSPGENSNAGMVHVIHGSLGGLVATGAQLLVEGTSGIPDAPEGGEQFGYALAAGDFDNDGRADLAIGAPFEDLPAVDAGSVTVVFGGAAQLNLAAGVEMWNQNSASVTDVSEANDAFGSALDAGDFDNDGFVDLAIGVPGETIDAIVVAFPGAGAVHLLRGGTTGMTATGNLFLHQDTAGIAGAAANNDHFGQKVRSGDYNGDAIADLAVAVPDEDSSGLADSGALHVLLSRVGGVTSAGSQMFSQDSASVLDVCEASDRYAGGL